jgi:hypothetical protein
LFLLGAAPAHKKTELPKTNSFEYKLDGGVSEREDRIAQLVAANEQITVELTSQTGNLWVINMVWCDKKGSSCFVEFASDKNEGAAAMFVWRNNKWAVFPEMFRPE